MGLFDVLDDLFDDLGGIFGGDDDGDGGDENDWPPQHPVPGSLPPGAPAWGPAPQVPNGPSGLQQGADQAGSTYQQASGAVNQTDDKLAGLLKQIFAANDDSRSKISAIVTNIETARRTLMSNPQTAADPHAMALFNQFLDGQLAQIQQILDSAKVDSKKQAELLAALGDEYRGTNGGDPKKKGKGDNNGTGGGDGDGDTGGGADGRDGGAGDGGGAGPGGSTTGGAGGLTDPLAGLGGAGMGDPLSMLGPAMAGLGAIPGSLGGAASSLPAGALGALGPLASGLAGQGGDGFKDGDTHDHGKSDDFEDGPHGKGDGGKNDATPGKDGSGDNNGATQPAGQTQPQPAAQPAPAAAVPASAGGDPSRVVQMPDGSPVTAPTAQHASAVRAVLNGSTVNDAWKQAHVELPPPGTPVTAPADPSHLVPGQIAQFKSRDPVMYMGNGKIWLDGQLQPQSAMPTGDFLGWVDPPELAGTTSAPPSPGTAAPAGQPTTTNTSGS